MASSAAFGWLCDQLEAATSMTRLESRGTVRLALRAAGLDPRTVTQREVNVLLERILPDELASKGIEDSNRLCGELAGRLGTAKLVDAELAETPESVFARLGG